ncbi:site-specific DNA-methyltransferase [Escherichia coli]|uniref:site-specific DNA-methyltransferase n=1 Tax=Escherichia coli TaxID=562 RepID=UPI001BB683A9|nr:site-specific DNA-methyltransferase [Escherichia coli]BCM54245.1 DNA methylase [Escherichia coli]
MSKYNELVKKLKEIFQIDRPELDFGIYRILNARADEINDYLDNKLKAKIQSALADAGNANKSELEHQLQLTIKAATDAGVDPADSPKVQELKKQLAAMASGANEHENAVFSHLLTFFSRYYDNGDFISKRRYKGNTYAIPYSGEEVMLHWANKDQYYIKSGENFANYSFKLDDGRKVSFKLLAADTAKDNRKDNELDRCFVLIEPHVRTKIDEEGDEYEQEYKPVEVVKNSSVVDGKLVETEELVIHFEYKAMKKGTKQDALVQSAISKILADKTVQQHWVDLAKRAPTEKNPSRTELERHLTTYTQRNTADYFIHKDLGGFLTNELDFYIKNEVMNLDNVQNAEVFANIEKQLRMIQCLRSVALELIAFLAQIENFQKKLWTKKKFVVSCNYLITLDLIPESLYPEIVKNDNQWDQWRKLGLWTSRSNGSINELIKNKSFSVDTSLFENSHEFIRNLNCIDDEISGLVINSDNYQGLRFLQGKFAESIDCIYIDPPYNSAASEILYKNEYKHSSWLSLMSSRYSNCNSLLTNKGIISTAIDDVEFHRLEALNNEIFGENNHLSNIAIMHNPKGRDQTYIAASHEYTIMFAKNKACAEVNRLKLTGDQVDKKYPKVDAQGRKYRELPLRRRGSSPSREDRPYMYFPFIYHPETGEIKVISKLEYDQIYKNNKFNDDYVESLRISYESKGMIFILPIRDDGSLGRWRWGYERSVLECENNSFFIRGRENPTIYAKDYVDDTYLAKSLWFDNRYDASTKGTNLLKDIIPNNGFDYPKSIFAVEDIIYMTSGDNSYILDFFGGSGTTAHAVMNLNNEFNSNRKYILIEMGSHCNSVIKPRIQKIIYSDKWKKGKPQSLKNGKSHICKIIKLQSNKDTLNNISLAKKNIDLLDLLSPEAVDDYVLKYMLESESKDSLLNIDNFKKPFNYEMDIATDSAGATERKNIDLVETFNYLIGLHVKSIESNIERGYVRVEGTLPTGERTLILWRDCDKIGYEELNKYANRFDLYAKENTFDVIYINGDHNLPTAFTVDEEDGEIVRSLKIRQIEPEFMNLMFAEEV